MHVETLSRGPGLMQLINLTFSKQLNKEQLSILADLFESLTCCDGLIYMARSQSTTLIST